MASTIERWMDGYRTAWDSNRPEDVLALFTADADYRTTPWAAPAHGGDAIVALWLRSADEADDHAFSWHPIGRDGDRHFVQGRTVYTDGRTDENLWIVDLAEDGRATAFTEWYMESASKPEGPNAGAARTRTGPLDQASRWTARPSSASS